MWKVEKSKVFHGGFPGGSVLRIHLPVQEMWIQSLGWEDLLAKKMAPHSSILAWKIPGTEEPNGVQSLGSQESNSTYWLTATNNKGVS